MVTGCQLSQIYLPIKTAKMSEHRSVRTLIEEPVENKNSFDVFYVFMLQFVQ